jgi:hypothetical protein
MEMIPHHVSLPVIINYDRNSGEMGMKLPLYRPGFFIESRSEHGESFFFGMKMMEVSFVKSVRPAAGDPDLGGDHAGFLRMR